MKGVPCFQDKWVFQIDDHDFTVYWEVRQQTVPQDGP